jgi:surface polysaccharide O-acyltransferase-like enzyme
MTSNQSSAFPTSKADLRHERFFGLDIFRILSTYAVVVLHSGLSHDFHISPAAARYQQFFNFAVPTFLALSFFLQVYRRPRAPFDFSGRWRRLMLPYFLWTAVHLAARSAKYAGQHESVKIHNLLSDPVGILFFGEASVQLYFLPLLFVGGFLCACLSQPLYKASRGVLSLLLIVTAVSYHVLLATGNGFELSTGCAFQNLAPPLAGHPILNQEARMILVCLSWFIRCLPYIVGVCLLVRFTTTRPFTARWSAIFWISLFLISILLPLPIGASEVLCGLAALATALAISSKVTSSRAVTSIASLTFGIFLMHDLVLEGVELIFNRLRVSEISLVQVVAISITTFSISAVVVWLGSRLGRPAQIILAVG